MVVVTMAVGFDIAGLRGEIKVDGVARSRKAAKKKAYRAAMSKLKRLAAPEQYRVTYSVVANQTTVGV